MSIPKKVGRELGVVWRDIFINTVLSSPLISSTVRWRVMKACGFDFGRARIRPGAWFSNKNISIGEGSFINDRVVFGTHGGIRIGRNVDIAMDVKLITSTHIVTDGERRAGPNRSEPIVVGDGTWIGAGAMVMPGVTIGERVIIAAGSVVIRDCVADCTYAGVPAKLIQDAVPE